MLQNQTVTPKLLGLIMQLQQMSALSGFVLVGGTSLSLQLGHRISVDIDLFTQIDFEKNIVVEELEKKYENNFLLLSASGMTVNCVIDNIKVDLLKHGYLYVEEPIIKESIKMLSMPDIAAMKLNAITGNRSKIKDFIDIYFLLDIFSLEQLFSFYKKKYPQQDIYQVKKSLVYFNDIAPETWNNVQLVKNKGLTFAALKSKLKAKIVEYEKNTNNIY